MKTTCNKKKFMCLLLKQIKYTITVNYTQKLGFILFTKIYLEQITEAGPITSARLILSFQRTNQMQTTSKTNSTSERSGILLIFFIILIKAKIIFIIHYAFLGYIFLFSSSHISTNTVFNHESSRTEVLQHQLVFGEAWEFC